MASDPVVTQIYIPAPLPVEVDVRRVDGSVIRCPVIVNKDGSLGVKAPRGEWLHEPPPRPLDGQEAFPDAGEAP